MKTMTTDEAATGSSHGQTIEQLRANAAYCRSLAQTATDPEVQLALTHLASDIETAIGALEEDARRAEAED